MSRLVAGTGRTRGGLTLIELMIALAVAVILGALAVPSYSAMLQQRRLIAAARHLAADLGEARQEAIRSGRAVQLRFAGDATQWCYVVVAGIDDPSIPDCAAGTGGTATLKRVTSADHPGIALLQAQPMGLAPNGAVVTLDAPSAALGNARGEQLRVRLSRMGRAAVCAPAQPVGDVPRC